MATHHAFVCLSPFVCQNRRKLNRSSTHTQVVLIQRREERRFDGDDKMSLTHYINQGSTHACYTYHIHISLEQCVTKCAVLTYFAIDSIREPDRNKLMERKGAADA